MSGLQHNPVKLKQDAESGNAQAQFLLSQHCFQMGDLPQMIHWLTKACGADLPVAHEALGYCLETGRGIQRNYLQAIKHYDAAIPHGAYRAAYRKAELLYKSKTGPDHQPEIRTLLNQSAGHDFAPAKNVLGYLATQNDELYPRAARSKQVLRPDPLICMFDNVVNPQQAQHLIQLATPHLTRADVIDPAGNKDGKTSEVRTNQSTFLPFHLIDFIGRHIEHTIVAAIGGDIAHSEPMSILFYGEGEYYEPHFDFFSPDLAVTRQHLADGGQRITSAITYLASPNEGGGTSFPKLGLQVPPKPGATLWFENCDNSAAPDPRTLHAGDPVIRGSKWVVTKWFREDDSGYMVF